MFRKKATQAPIRRKPTPPLPRNAGVFSYHAARSRRPDNVGRDTAQDNALDSRTQAQKRSRRSKRLFTAVVVIVLLLVAANALIVSSKPQISVVGNKNSQAFLQKQEVYQQAAAQFMEGSALNRNKITFDTSSINQQMLDMFPELEAVSISQSILGHTPILHIQAFTPRLILVSGSDTFVLSQEGRAFLPASKVPSMERFDLPVVRDQSGLAIRERKIALPEREVAFIKEVHHQLKTSNLQVTGYTLLPSGSELEVQIKDEPHKVRFNLYGNAREGAGRYLAAREYLKSRSETPRDYIDVRVDNHVYYR